MMKELKNAVEKFEKTKVWKVSLGRVSMFMSGERCSCRM